MLSLLVAVYWVVGVAVFLGSIRYAKHRSNYVYNSDEWTDMIQLLVVSLGVALGWVVAVPFALAVLVTKRLFDRA